MRSSAKRVEAPVAMNRTAYRTIDGWALGTLMTHGAVRECDDHGHMRDRSDPDAWDQARREARQHPFPGTSADQSASAIDEVMRSIGDSCPAAIKRLQQRRAWPYIENSFGIVELEFMAPRAYWKGFLRLSLVTCPIALFPATSEAEKISFNQINKKTGHRVKYQKVDADTGEEVPSGDIIKGYKVDADTYLEVSKDELEAISLESTRTIDIGEFVPRNEIDDLYMVRPYYIVPDGKVGHDAYSVIRETIRTLDKVALARVVLTSREHVIALEARGKGLMGMLLRYPYEVRDAAEYFDDIQDVKITKEMLDLAKHIVETKSGHFDPNKFEDHYEAALQELLQKKQKGLPIEKAAQQTSGNVINLMDALKASLKGGKPPAAEKTVPAKKTSKAKATPKRKAG